MKLFLIIKSLLIYTLFTSCNSYSQDNIENYFNDLIAENKFNGNALVVKNDSLHFEISNGFADPSKNAKLSAQYYFGIGSIQKEFPGVAIMLLQENGKLDVTDKLSNHLPNLPGWGNKIQIKHLLNYSSGLPQIDWGSYFSKGLLRETEVLEDVSNIQELAFEPGSGYIYSNYNPILLRAIVEQVSGKKFKDYLEENILKEFGIEGIIVQEKFPFVNKRNMSIPFNDKFEEDALEFEMFMAMATTRGLYNWFRKLDNFEIISKESYQTLSKLVKEGDDIQSALGFIEWKNDKLQSHVHHGSSGNYDGLVHHNKAEDLYIVLLTNRKKGNTFEIAAIIQDISRELDAKATGEVYAKPLRYNELIKLTNNGEHHQLSEEIQNKPEYEWSRKLIEEDINMAGYYFMEKGEYKKAIDLFKLNVNAFPQSANVYDSLGEAYMQNGNKVMAIRNYKKSVELNPQNENAIAMLEKLQKKD